MSNTCRPVPPFLLPSFPITDDEAEALGLLEILDEEQPGGTCECQEDEEAYIPPECPECEDCDDVTGDKEFTISGATGDHAVFNGTWTGAKGAGDCEAESCCWAFFNEGATLGPYHLSWAAGVWTLVLDDATYTVTASVCIDPIVLSKISGGAGLPSTITIDNDV